MDMILELKHPEKSLLDKLNRMDWLARHAEYLSPGAVARSLQTFREQLIGPNQQSR